MDARNIIISERQRKTVPVLTDDFIQSVSKLLINPITLRQGDEGPELVAGFRRLSALIAAEKFDLEENIHFRFIETLNPLETKIIELEENAKREDLTWQDTAVAIASLHNAYCERSPGWSKKKTQEELNVSQQWLDKNLMISKHIGKGIFRDATSTNHAYSILQQLAARKAANIISEIQSASILSKPDEGSGGNETEFEFSISNTPSSGEAISPNLPPASQHLHLGNSTQPLAIHSSPGGATSQIENNEPIIRCEDFLNFAPAYSGEKFTLIHCDFPYEIRYDSYAKSSTSSTEDYDFSGYWPLVDCLLDNLDRLASYSSHIMFWFSMKFYCETKRKLEGAGLYVHDHPLIWHKSDNAGIIPGRDGVFPRRVYETAFLCSRGRRPLVKSLSNHYSAPTPSNPIHPSQKSEPMLNHFFAMLVDETSDVLDPTCGSGSAIRAAKRAGARRVLGLELNPEYARTAQGIRS